MSFYVKIITKRYFAVVYCTGNNILYVSGDWKSMLLFSMDYLNGEKFSWVRKGLTFPKLFYALFILFDDTPTIIRHFEDINLNVNMNYDMWPLPKCCIKRKQKWPAFYILFKMNISLVCKCCNLDNYKSQFYDIQILQYGCTK